MFKTLFKKLSDVVHFLLGFLACVFLLAKQYFFGISIIVCFIIYQVLDYLKGEDPKETCKDVQEFVVGFIGAIFVLFLISFIYSLM